ncbi:hypothetical protein ACTXT7_016986 [Hymenolepis weldensis]
MKHPSWGFKTTPLEKYQASWYRKIWCDHCTKSHIIEFQYNIKEPRRLSRNRLFAITFPLYEVK